APHGAIVRQEAAVVVAHRDVGHALLARPAHAERAAGARRRAGTRAARLADAAADRRRVGRDRAGAHPAEAVARAGLEPAAARAARISEAAVPLELARALLAREHALRRVRARVRGARRAAARDREHHDHGA